VVSVIDGVPGAGKSSMMFDLTARITNGRPMPHSGVESRGGAEAEGQLQGDRRQAEGAGTQPGALQPPPSDSPDSPNPPKSPPRTGRVVLVSMEDPIESVVRPRVRASGADMSRVMVLNNTEEFTTRGESSDSLLELPRDLDLIDAECRKSRSLPFSAGTRRTATSKRTTIRASAGCSPS
jgi:hypothetical protein